MMTSRFTGSTPDATESTPMLRWILQRRGAALTCEVTATPNGTYDVCIVPHWDVSLAVLETYDGATEALRRHAEIARWLRDEGWTVSDYVPVQTAQAA